MTENTASSNFEDMAEIFKLLGEPWRLNILAKLYLNPGVIVNTMADEAHTGQEQISHHLALLRTAGMVDYVREGKNNGYFLTPAFSECYEKLSQCEENGKISLGATISAVTTFLSNRSKNDRSQLGKEELPQPPSEQENAAKEWSEKLRKNQAFNSSMTELFHALGDDGRLRILHAIAQSPDGLYVGQIAGQTGLGTTNVSYHLKILKDANMLTSSRDGKRVFYTLSDRFKSSDEMMPKVSNGALIGDKVLQNGEADESLSWIDKITNNPKTIDSLTRTFKLLGGKRRFEVLYLLSNHPQGMSSEEMCDAFHVTQNTVNVLITPLIEANLVTRTRDGHHPHYTLSKPFKNFLAPLLAKDAKEDMSLVNFIGLLAEFITIRQAPVPQK